MRLGRAGRGDPSREVDGRSSGGIGKDKSGSNSELRNGFIKKPPPGFTSLSRF